MHGSQGKSGYFKCRNCQRAFTPVQSCFVKSSPHFCSDAHKAILLQRSIFYNFHDMMMSKCKLAHVFYDTYVLPSLSDSSFVKLEWCGVFDNRDWFGFDGSNPRTIPKFEFFANNGVVIACCCFGNGPSVPLAIGNVELNISTAGHIGRGGRYIQAGRWQHLFHQVAPGWWHVIGHLLQRTHILEKQLIVQLCRSQYISNFLK